jgi:tetratricopeptide (TPR) repeat protein
MAPRLSSVVTPLPAQLSWTVSSRHRLSASRAPAIDEEITMWRGVLERDPGSALALRALEELYELTGRAEDYLDLVERRVDQSGSDEERDDMYQRMAAAWEDTFHRPDRARRCLEKRLALAPSNAAAYQPLERVLVDLQDYQALADLLGRHVRVADPGQRLELLRARAMLLDQKLGDAARAAKVYREILRAAPDDAATLAALARLLETNGRWDDAITVLRRLAKCQEDPGAEADVHHRLGVMHLERRHDPGAAHDHLERALALNPSHSAAALALAGLHRERHEWPAAAALLARAAAGAGVIERTQTALLLEAAQLYEERVRDPARAAELYLRLLAIDPEHVPAAERLTAILVPAARFAELEPVIDMLARKKAGADPPERAAACLAAATTAERLGKDEKAFKYYRQALGAAPTSLAALQACADLCARTGQEVEALGLYGALLRHHEARLGAQAVAAVLLRLGTLQARRGEPQLAVARLAQAVHLDPRNRDAIEALIDLYVEAGRWNGVVTAYRALAAIAAPEEHAALLVTIADVYREKLRDPERAVAAYLEALERRPDDRVVRQHLLNLYTATRRWPEAVATLQRIADLEADPALRAKYLYAAALLERDKSRDLPAALELCNQALDVNPDHLVAFQAIDRALTAAKSWPALEAQYLRMTARIDGAGSGTPARRAIAATLWDNLGEIYRSRLQDYRRATAAYERALALRPDDARLLTILGELHAGLGPSHSRRALEAQHALVRQAPGNPEPYRALRRLYLKAGAHDRAYCACSALATLQAADASDRAVVERFRPQGLVRPTRRLTEALWTRCVRHPTEDPRVGAVLAALCDTVARPRARALADFGVRRRRPGRRSQHQRVASIIAHVSELLGGPAPETCESPTLPTPVTVANCQEEGVLVPTLLVRSDLLGELSDAQLAFVAARQLTVLRPEHFLVLVVPTLGELRTLYLAGLQVAGLPLGAALTAAVASCADELRTALPPPQLERLTSAAPGAAADLVGADLERWRRAIELTSHRAGLVACGDPELAVKMVMTSSAATAEMRHELCSFVASLEYFALREHLGVTIAPAAGPRAGS